MKICIFPNDPIISYYEKGEIKERYFNPNNFFDEIHIISLIETDVEDEKVKILAGNAKLKIHSVGNVNIKNRFKYKEKIIDMVKTINPDVIRAFNPLLSGWFAAHCSKELKIPLFVSLHTQYDQNRSIIKKTNLKKFLAMKYTERFIEPFVLKTANKITIIYKIIEPYVLKHSSEKPEVLYNKVDCKRFSNGSRMEHLSKPLILSVGNLSPVKNHKCLIESMQKINAHLLIIGNGELYTELTELIKKYNLVERVKIEKSVPHEKIQNYYKSAQVFALAYNTKVESLPMPVMEAMASGLPIVVPYPENGFSEGLEDVAVFTQNNPESFAKNLQKLLLDEELRKIYSQRSQKKALEFDEKKIEVRESKIYAEIIGGK